MIPQEPYSTTFSTPLLALFATNVSSTILLHSRSTELHLRRRLSSFATLPKPNRVHKPWSWFGVDLGLSRVERASRSPKNVLTHTKRALVACRWRRAIQLRANWHRGGRNSGRRQRRKMKNVGLLFLYPWLQQSTGFVRMGSALRSRACSS